MGPENEQLEDLPRGLIDELKAADRELPIIASRVDREILSMAEAQFAERQPQQRFARPTWAAAAAMVLIAVFVFSNRAPLVNESTDLYADVDGSGRIDIADVLAYARAARASGEYSQAEIDAFAKQVVSLNPVGDAS